MASKYGFRIRLICIFSHYECNNYFFIYIFSVLGYTWGVWTTNGSCQHGCRQEFSRVCLSNTGAVSNTSHCGMRSTERRHCALCDSKNLVLFYMYRSNCCLWIFGKYRNVTECKPCMSTGKVTGDQYYSI